MAVKTTLNKEQIFQRLHEHTREIKSFEVYRLGLFGSVVRGEENNDSDVDILVEFNKGQKTYDNFIELAFYLDELLEKEVQLVTRQAIADWLFSDIKNEIEYVNFYS